MSECVSGSIAGARFRFDCDDVELSNYARVHLARALEQRVDKADVDVVLRWHDDLPPPVARSSELDSMQRVDRDLYLGDGVIHWFRVDDARDLRLRFRWDGEQLQVEGEFYFRVGNRAISDRLRRLVAPRQTLAMRRRRYTTLVYYLVYYPCWWWLEHMRGFHPVHAAGIAAEQGGIVVAGGSGIGKSTLAVLLGMAPGAKLLSDSFVMHRGGKLLPVREPLLIDAPAQAWLEGLCEALEPIDWSYLLGRGGFHFPGERLANEARTGLLLFPRRTAKPYWRPVATEQAAAWLSAGDMIINDLRRYWSFAAVLEYLVSDGLMARRESDLRDLAARSLCYEIGLNFQQPSAQVLRSVSQLCEGLPAAAITRERTALPS